MRATIRQVAERAGVSRTTVSNVLLGRDDIVAPEKRELVLQAAREMEYVPVRPTLQNRHVETHVIAVPMDDPHKINWGINSGTYIGICEAAMKLGYDITMLLRRNPDWAVEGSQVQLLDRRSDGVLFASPTIGETRRTFEVLDRHKVPAVVCYRRDVPEGIAWADPDNKGAMYQAVAHLLENGHSKFVHLTHRQDPAFDKVERRRYFMEAACHYGLENCRDWIVEVDYFNETPEVAHHIMKMGATAVVCMNDLLAIDLIRAMQSGGLSVPDDLSIIGMDGLKAEDYGLTSMEFSFFDVGYQAAEALVELIQGKPAPECNRVIPVTLVSRRSVKNLRST